MLNYVFWLYPSFLTFSYSFVFNLFFTTIMSFIIYYVLSFILYIHIYFVLTFNRNEYYPKIFKWLTIHNDNIICYLYLRPDKLATKILKRSKIFFDFLFHQSVTPMVIKKKVFCNQCLFLHHTLCTHVKNLVNEW